MMSIDTGKPRESSTEIVSFVSIPLPLVTVSLRPSLEV